MGSSSRHTQRFKSPVCHGGGVASESHLSVWRERDLLWHDLWAWANCRSMTLLVLRGFQRHRLPQTADRTGGAQETVWLPVLLTQ